MWNTGPEVPFVAAPASILRSSISKLARRRFVWRNTLGQKMQSLTPTPSSVVAPVAQVSMFRKNGKPTSCEPCRISKVRCDHITPICRRCEKRGIAAKCYYHEAPLTRAGPKNRDRVTKPQISTIPRADIVRRRVSYPENVRTYPGTSEEKDADGGTTIQNAYLGSTSFLSVFQETPSGFSSCSLISPQVDLGRWGYDVAHTELNLTRLLSAFDLYEELIVTYYKSCLLPFLPIRLVLDPLRATRAYLDSNGWLQESRRRELYAKITQNTAVSLHVSGTSLEDFTSLFSGENLRWEFVGVIYSLVGLSVLSEPFHSTGLCTYKREPLDEEAFAKEMAASANSHHVYAVVGDLVTDIYGMGLHRYKPPDTDVPFFLSEVRKRLVAATYRADKTMATLLGRPPRLPYHYCDVSLPLDIEDEDLFLDGDALETVLQKLTHDGWNSGSVSDGKMRAATAIRLRYISSILREKVLRLSLGRKGANFSNDLQETYQECKQMWDGVPGWFHYRPNCWEILDPVICIVSLVIYLECIHTIFQIERIRCRENEGPVRDLLDTSMQAVSAVIDFTKQGEKKGNKIWKHFAWVFLLYALPTAGVLATELHRCTITETPLSSTAPRSEVIRNLSTIVSWFECTDLSLNVTHNACVEVSKAINKLLDDTLNYQPGTSRRRIGGNETVAAHAVSSEGPRVDADAIVGNTKPYDVGAQTLHPEPFGNDLTNGISIGTGESFLSWLDELGMDTSIPEFLL
ncbi:uncharacterized protein GIQ15_05288 [Arthroderma uncinatum]|uniref:uncharacterized protein n=1 Tax=Arthroderma uncinatum TaxID=74035 RepID=UPI00144A4F63|nr:uncharacterized protein GIQ15_05288 [Arthroderma uncinatum]KAF3482529.1 hypothetical protein GIQ15_05288 [Arthroderma uncinatum]